MARALFAMLSQTEEGEGSYRQKIEYSLENVPKFVSEENQNQLKSILENTDWLKKHESSIEYQWNWVKKKAYLECFSDIQVEPKHYSIYEKRAILDNIFCGLASSLLEEIQNLGMDEGYKELMKTTHYEKCLFFWDWIVEEVSYQKCLFKIQEARNKGKDMSMFDDLEKEVKNCTIYEKTSLVLKRLEESTSAACMEILSSIENEGFFTIEPYSLTE